MILERAINKGHPYIGHPITRSTSLPTKLPYHVQENRIYGLMRKDRPPFTVITLIEALHPLPQAAEV